MDMKINNRRAFHDYFITDKFEAGLSLTGAEVASIKQGRANINAAFVRIRNGEAWLVGANIPLSQFSSLQGYDPGRLRKVLLHKSELVSLSTKLSADKLTLVLLSLYTKGRLVKAQLALGKGKKQYEKREVKRRKDLDRDTERALKDRN